MSEEEKKEEKQPELITITANVNFWDTVIMGVKKLPMEIAEPVINEMRKQAGEAQTKQKNG